MNTPDYTLDRWGSYRGTVVMLNGYAASAAISDSNLDPDSKFGDMFDNTPAHYFSGGEADRTGMSWVSAYSGLSTYLNIPERAYGLRSLYQMMTTIHILESIVLYHTVGHGLGMILVK